MANVGASRPYDSFIIVGREGVGFQEQFNQPADTPYMLMAWMKWVNGKSKWWREC